MYKLLGARHLDIEAYGFLQPIFQVVDTQTYYYQIITDGLIEEFEPCKADFEIKSESFHYCDQELLFNVNDKAAYFFLARDKQHFAGKLDDIDTKISRYLYDPAYNFLEKIEIATELSCWGFLNNQHKIKDEDFTTDFEEDDTEIPMVTDLKFCIEQSMLQQIPSEEKYIAFLNEQAEKYGLTIRDLLIYYDRYAIAGRSYCHLSGTLIRKIDDDSIVIDNLKNIQEELAGELLKMDDALFRKLEERIDRDKDGVEILELLQPLVISILKLLRPAEKQKIELLVSESSKGPRQISLLPDGVKEVSQMADIVIKNRKRHALV